MFTRRPLAAVAAALTLTLAACGGSDSRTSADDGIASLGTDAAPDDATPDPTGSDSGADTDSGTSSDDGAGEGVGDGSEAEAPTDPDEAFALYDQCLQEAGIDTSIFEAGGSGGGVVVEGDVTGQVGEDSDVLLEAGDESFAAFEECEKHLANTDTGFDLSPEQQAELADAELAFARCMRDQGIDWPDPSPGDDGNVAVEFDESEFDPEQMEAAFAECDSVFDEIFGELDGDVDGNGESS